MMRMLLAAYDPNGTGPGGSHWVWAHPAVPSDVLEAFYYTVAVADLPEDPGSLRQEDCHGGWAALDGTWACFYRFYNGGHDPQGRPGRFVLLCAFHHRWEASPVATVPIIEDGPFAEMAQCPALGHVPIVACGMDYVVDVDRCFARGSHSEESTGARAFLQTAEPHGPEVAQAIAATPSTGTFLVKMRTSNGGVIVDAPIPVGTEPRGVDRAISSTPVVLPRLSRRKFSRRWSRRKFFLVGCLGGFGGLFAALCWHYWADVHEPLLKRSAISLHADSRPASAPRDIDH